MSIYSILYSVQDLYWPWQCMTQYMLKIKPCNYTVKYNLMEVSESFGGTGLLYYWLDCSSLWQLVGRNCSCVWLYLAYKAVYLLWEERLWNRLCIRVWWSAVLFAALFLTLEMYKCWMKGRSAQMIFINDLQSWLSLWSVSVLFAGWSKPDSDGWTENRLGYISVGLDQQLLRQVNFLSWCKKYILCWAFLMTVDVGCPF